MDKRATKNFPPQPGSFIGREREITEAKRWLAASRLLTITGAGGCGKTRFALQIAEGSRDQFEHGVWLIELAALSDAHLVAQAVASVLDIQAGPGSNLAETLWEFLSEKSLLLVLDNCEHLIHAVAEMAATLLQKCPNARILATSREALHVGGELVYHLPSLSYADPEALPSAAIAAQYESIRLFAERAQAVQADFALTATNLPSVAQICFRLDGIPLAIELAAARLTTLDVHHIAAGLHDQFGILTGGKQTALPRQQTLDATLDWSYNLLSRREKLLLCRLSVFSGRWTLEQAIAVTKGRGLLQEEFPNLLSRLVEKSILVREPSDGTPRYRLLDMIRQYADLRLQPAGEREAAAARHLDFFLSLAEEWTAGLRGPAELACMRRLSEEIDNLRAALTHALALRDSRVLRLAVALAPFFGAAGLAREGRSWLERALPQFPQAEQRLGAAALGALGLLCSSQSDHEAARAHLERSIALGREANDRAVLGRALNGLGFLTRHEGNIPAARTLFQESLALHRQLADKSAAASSIFGLADLLSLAGDIDGARVQFQESARLCREVGYRSGLAQALVALGDMALLQSDEDSALAYYEEGESIYRLLGSKWGMSLALSNMGHIWRGQGRYEPALQAFSQALSHLRQVGSKRHIVGVLEEMAAIIPMRSALGSSDVSNGMLQRSIRVLSAAAAQKRALGFEASRSDRADFERDVSILQKRLDKASFDQVWTQGQSMTLEQAVTEIEYLVSSSTATLTRSHTAPAFALTRRELQVLRLVASGLSNRQIADQLVLSNRTVDAHVASIYAKLHVNRRSAAKRLALEHKIV